LADKADVNVILVETFREYPYKNVNKTIFFNGEFNYNHCLNLGLQYRTGDIQILANNDIIFQRGWSTIGDTMRAQGYLSASALSNHPRQRAFKRGDYAYEGYEICLYMTGWCIFCDSKLWDIIGLLDESYTFWYSDNMYINQLSAKRIPHYLICNVTVLHYISRTLNKQDFKTKMKLTDARRKDLTHAERKTIHKSYRAHL
jgi:hypothetical protein